MKLLSSMLLTATIAFPLAAQQPTGTSSAPLPLDRIVAIVGGTPILYSEVMEVVQQRRAQGATFPDDSAAAQGVIRQIISDLVDEELLVQQAASDTSIKVADADLTATVDQQIQQIRQQLPNDQEFLTALKQSGFGNQEEYRRWMMDRARRLALQQRYVEKLQREGKMLPAPVSDAEVTEAYEREKNNLPKRPPSVTFRQIVIPTMASPAAKAAAKARAESLLTQLRNGADFEQLARRESMDSVTRELGGDLGWNRREVMVPAFADAMFSLPPGQVSSVVETQYGYHIIRVDRVKPSEVKARHILIRPRFDTADVERARALADSVLGLWKAGVPYDTLLRKFHDRDETEGSLEPFPMDKLPESYAKAFQGRQPDEFVPPFAIQDPQRGVPKFVVARIVETTPAGDYTLAEVRQQIRQQLQNEKSFRRMIDSLKERTFVTIVPDVVPAKKSPR